MKKVVLTILMLGTVMNAYGAEVDDGRSSGGRQPLASLTNLPDIREIEKLYPNCKSHIRAEVEDSYKEGIEEGKYKAMLAVAIRMFKKNGTYTPDIVDLTGVTEARVREALAKEKGK